MYAIVEIAGQQFKIAKDQKVFVNRLSTEEGKKVTFDNVLLIGDGDNITIGAPAIGGALIGAKVLRHLKGDKVIVFKKKRRKGYRKKNGHRQYLSEIVIESISTSDKKKSDDKDAQAAKPEAPKKAEKVEKVEAKKIQEEKVEAKPKAKEAPKKAEKVEKVEAKKIQEEKVEAKPKAKEETKKAPVKEAEPETVAEFNSEKVLASIGTAKKADADDLKKINGIGPAYEKRLNEVGIYTYEQISKLKTADKVELSVIDGITRDKIDSEEWVEQAIELLKDKK
ncbi:large subunit ribosomal protein L21 [Flavobacteriaceae bacterium MAR_2010_188]|nr:large subunit ribosomal protein L21 [Flavobacteriaceae bacterium MAR_2010_188]